MIKAIELKYGRKSFLLRIISKFDHHSISFVNKVKFKCFQIIQSIRYIFLIEVKNILENKFRNLKERVVEEYKNRESIIMGKKQIGNRGSVSFFLKKIDETKRNGHRGEIL